MVMVVVSCMCVSTSNLRPKANTKWQCHHIIQNDHIERGDSSEITEFKRYDNVKSITLTRSVISCSV